MKMAKFVQRFAAILTVVGIVIPRTAVADQVALPAKQAVTDVSLSENGSLHGQVVNTGGVPMAGSDVEVRSGVKVLAASVTNDDGEFAVTGLRGGIYEVATDAGQVTVRAWSQGTAPPAAQTGILVVDGDTTVRGAHFLANPWLLGGIAILAITLPLVLDDDDDAS